MVLHRILLGIDALAAAVVLYFFLWGLEDGSVSGANLGLWLGILAFLGAVLGGGIVLRRRGWTVAANLVLTLLALPALLHGLFVLTLVLGSGGRWN